MAVVFRLNPILLLTAACLLAGCQTSPPGAEPGPDKTLAQYLKIESSVPGVTIETNSVYAGKTPLTLRIFADPPGTFHDFGAPQYIVRALPLNTNQFVQTKIFKTGKRSAPGDSIPGVVFFDVTQPAGVMQIDSFPDK